MTTHPKNIDLPDARLHAYRADLAAKKLSGKVDARRFIEGELCQAKAALSPLRRTPDVQAPLVSEVLFGERVTLYEVEGDWAWVQMQHDNYVGYMPAKSLAPAAQDYTHHVSALGTFVYPRPDIKAPPTMRLCMNARLRITGGRDQFLELDGGGPDSGGPDSGGPDGGGPDGGGPNGGGYVFSRHVRETRRPALDFVAVAERFIGVPYLWGGRTSLGIDCSGLVQLALEAAGIAAPRDSDMQQKDLGETVLVPNDLEGLQRGDLIFWPGHVGIMLDGVFVLHANAHHMAVAVEALHDTDMRIAKTSGSAATAIKRLEHQTLNRNHYDAVDL